MLISMKIANLSNVLNVSNAVVESVWFYMATSQYLCNFFHSHILIQFDDHHRTMAS